MADSWWKELDELLRGRKTTPELLKDGRLDLSLKLFLPVGIVLGAAYGFFMGWFAVIGRDPASWLQMLASVVKLPALFLLTLVVTFPSLYVFNALVGCRLSFMATLRLLIAATVVNVAVAASLGPILGFFTLSTTSYSFMVLLNVALMGIAGVVGLSFLLHTLRRLAMGDAEFLPPRPAEPRPQYEGPPAEEGGPPEGPPRAYGPLDRLPGYAEPGLGQARSIFRIWVIIYGLVGAQMGWLLRPFIGAPEMEFTWFRNRQGNFFESVWFQLQKLLGVG